MGIWETLPPPSLNGITFPLSGRKVSGGRAFAKRQYPFRNGQQSEDTGREPRQYEYQIPLYAGMDGFNGVRFSQPLYPDTYDAIRDLAESDEDQAYAELVDPEHGPIQVKIASWSWGSDPSKRDGGELTLSMIEELPQQSALFSVTDDAASTAQLEAENLDAAFESSGVSITFLPAGFTTVSDYIASYTAAVSGAVTFDVVAAHCDAVRASLTAAMQTPFLLEAANYRALWSISTLLDSVTRTAERAISDGPNVVEWVVPVPMSSHDIALELYKDSSLYLEIEQRNPTPHPLFYPAGTTVYAAVRI